MLRLQRAAGNRAVAQLMRQPTPPGQVPAGGLQTPAAAPKAAAEPTVKDGRDKDELIVTRADGSVYHVRRVKRGQKVIDHGRVRAGLCYDSRRVFLRFQWCEGTQGTIDVGANPQGAFGDALNNTVQAINQRKNADAVLQTLLDSPIESFADVDIVDAGKWKVTGNIAIDINRSGVAKATGGVKTDFGWVRVGIDASDVEQQLPGGAPPGKQVGATVEFPLGGGAPKGKTCPRSEVEILWDYECFREQKTTDMLDPRLGHHLATPTINTYFDYATTQPPKPKTGTSQLNVLEAAKLEDLLAEGYKVTSIEGYASPEGRRGGPGPKDVGAAKKWEGNNVLSEERASRAKQLLTGRRGSLGMRLPLKFDPLNVPAGGRGEHPLLDRARKAASGNPGEQPADGSPLPAAELEGSDLERKVIELFTQDPAEMARVTPDDARFINDSRNSLHDRAERVYAYLRRAEIHLFREWFEKPEPVAISDVEYVHETCPADILEAIQRRWGQWTPPEKSVCTATP